MGLTAQEQALLLYDIKLQCLQNISEHDPEGRHTQLNHKSEVILLFSIRSSVIDEGKITRILSPGVAWERKSAGEICQKVET